MSTSRKNFIALALVLATGGSCASGKPQLSVDLRPRMTALRTDAALLATLLRRGRIEDAYPPAERLSRADFGPVAELPSGLATHLALFRKRSEFLRDAAVRGALAEARTAFDEVVSSCVACHRDFRQEPDPIEVSFENP